MLHHITIHGGQTSRKRSISACGSDTCSIIRPASSKLQQPRSLSDYACRRNRLARWILRPPSVLVAIYISCNFFFFSPARRQGQGDDGRKKKEKKKKRFREDPGVSRGRVSTRATPKRATPLRYLIILRRLCSPPQGADRSNFVSPRPPAPKLSSVLYLSRTLDFVNVIDGSTERWRLNFCWFSATFSRFYFALFYFVSGLLCTASSGVGSILIDRLILFC